MKYCIIIYTMGGKVDKIKYYSCSGCGWKFAPKDVPVCMRKRTKDGEIIKKNGLYTAVVEKE